MAHTLQVRCRGAAGRPLQAEGAMAHTLPKAPRRSRTPAASGRRHRAYPAISAMAQQDDREVREAR
eukprot:3889041-Lingulodinium_polyedra.AAC.1